MSVFDDDLDLYYQEGHDVTAYPVAAESVAAYVAGGGSGTTVRGLYFTRDELADGGGVPVQVTLPYFETLKTRADAASLAVGMSAIEYNGQVYNVLSGAFKDPGFMEFGLEELVE